MLRSKRSTMDRSYMAGPACDGMLDKLPGNALTRFEGSKLTCVVESQNSDDRS
jgi:hypothetical protein